MAELRVTGFPPAAGDRRGRAASALRRRIRLAAALAALVPLLAVPRVAAARPAPAGAPSAPRAAPARASARTSSWPSSNLDLANTRATTNTPITAKNVARLTVKWRFPLTGTATYFGHLASAPIVVGDTVYLIDLDSTVFALDRDTGTVKWQHAFNSGTIGPNGVAYADGVVVGTTDTGVFGLDARTGATLWAREMVVNGLGSVDVAPQIFDDIALVATAPTTYVPGTMGTVFAYNVRTGALIWQFNTVKDGDLWGHPELNSGGGLWYPPAVDSRGRVFLDVGNPGPFPGTAQYPNGSSRLGSNLYTDSLVALDGRTGKLLWYQQAIPHDIRDYDLQDSPVLADVDIHGKKTEVVYAAGKMGKVYAFRAADGTPLWTLEVGKHQNDTGPLPDTTIMVYPGVLGGVETPMAVASGRLFVPWVDDPSPESSTSYAFPDLTRGKGGITAADARTGKVLWERDLPTLPVGAATVANDVVFTSTYDGTVYAFDTKTGATLWTTTARAGINGFPAVSGNNLLIGAGAPGFSANPIPELVDYELR